MTFLPVVARELRVAARKRSTFWLRVAAALVGLVLGTGFLIICWLARFGTAQLGRGLFGILSYVSLGAALCAGLFFTADALSEEKREGTLGLLFLTDLRGYGVVAGKLLSTSLRGFYALLALFPVLAITLILGGVTGAQLWKTCLALVSALLCSLGAGLLISAISRDAQRALAGTFFLLLILAAGGPIMDQLIASLRHQVFKPWLSHSSPVCVFLWAGAWGRSPFWSGLCVTFLVTALEFGAASLLIPRTWQVRVAKNASFSAGWAYVLKYGTRRRRQTLRRRLLDRGPVLWLACREQWQALAIWGIAGLVGIGFGVVFATKLPHQAWVAWGAVGGMIMLAVYLWASSQAPRFFIEARRSGLIELLLVAPLNARQIVQGHWAALLRLFGLPVGLLLLFHLVGMCLSQHASGGTVVAAAGGSGPSLIVHIVTGGLTVLATAGNLIALAWFGMWMGMTSKNPGLAALKNILFVMVVPWFVLSFLSMVVALAVVLPNAAKWAAAANSKAGTATITATMSNMPLLMAGVGTVFSLAKDVAFVIWSRRKLLSSFRQQACGSPSLRVGSPAPPPPAPVNVPPIITQS
jgi:hypothetical protein